MRGAPSTACRASSSSSASDSLLLTQRGSEPFPAPGDDRWVDHVARDPTDHAAEPAVHRYFVEEATEVAVEAALWRLAI